MTRKLAGYPPAGLSQDRVASIRILSACPQAAPSQARSESGKPFGAGHRLWSGIPDCRLLPQKNQSKFIGTGHLFGCIE
jgi:hypothetical protein